MKFCQRLLKTYENRSVQNRFIHIKLRVSFLLDFTSFHSKIGTNYMNKWNLSFSYTVNRSILHRFHVKWLMFVKIKKYKYLIHVSSMQLNSKNIGLYGDDEVALTLLLLIYVRQQAGRIVTPSKMPCSFSPLFIHEFKIPPKSIFAFYPSRVYKINTC